LEPFTNEIAGLAKQIPLKNMKNTVFIPFSLPAFVITVAGYAASIGLAITTVSQLTVEHKKGLTVEDIIKLGPELNRKLALAKKRKAKKEQAALNKI
jgi:hypothetical protein